MSGQVISLARACFLVPLLTSYTGTNEPLYSTDAGYAVSRGNDFGGASNTALAGTFTSPPYSYSLTAVGSVRAAVTASAGQTLTF